MTDELVVREARAGDARAIAEVSVASRRWSYLNVVAEADQLCHARGIRRHGARFLGHQLVEGDVLTEIVDGL